MSRDFCLFLSKGYRFLSLDFSDLTVNKKYYSKFFQYLSDLPSSSMSKCSLQRKFIYLKLNNVSFQKLITISRITLNKLKNKQTIRFYSSSIISVLHAFNFFDWTQTVGSRSPAKVCVYKIKNIPKIMRGKGKGA